MKNLIKENKLILSEWYRISMKLLIHLINRYLRLINELKILNQKEQIFSFEKRIKSKLNLK